MRVDLRFLGPLAGLAMGLACLGPSANGHAAWNGARSGPPSVNDRELPATTRGGTRQSVEPVAAGAASPGDGAPVEVLVRHMPEGLREADIARRLREDPDSLGSLSIGRPNHGALVGGRQMPDAPFWHVVEPEKAFGTDETIASIVTAVARVRAEFPGTPEFFVGNISARGGGYLRPHRSHQSGRDADLGYFYKEGPGWYARANASNLDLPRTWALVEAFAADSNVEAIFIDRSVQRLLRDYAERNGESPSRLDALFERRPGRHDPGECLIRHEWGHLTHLHVRFKSPVATEAGAQARRPFDVWKRSLPRRPAPRHSQSAVLLGQKPSGVSRARPRSPS